MEEGRNLGVRRSADTPLRSGMTVFWIYTLAENWRYPTLLTKVVAVFAMLLQILFAAQSLATAHSVSVYRLTYLLPRS